MARCNCCTSLLHRFAAPARQRFPFRSCSRTKDAKLSDFAFLLAGLAPPQAYAAPAPSRRGHCPLHAPAAAATAAPAATEHAALPPPSSAAQKLYTAARADILQVRVLLKNGRTQSSVGSGFLIGTSNLVVTNYHVVSQFALDPDTYVGEWVDTGGQRGNVELLAVDVLHDLAVLRVNRNGTGFFKMPEQLAP
jgi:S1-C subfamily serine protease